MHAFARDFCRASLASVLLQAAGATWAQAPSTAKAPREDLTIDPATIMQPWTGDLDGMVERRLVRVLVVPNKTTYSQDRGKQRGATYEAMKVVERS